MDRVISERALGAFLDVMGTVERVCESRHNQVDTEVGSADICSSSDLRVACSDVIGVVSESSSELSLRSSSEKPVPSSEYVSCIDAVMDRYDGSPFR